MSFGINIGFRCFLQIIDYTNNNNDHHDDDDDDDSNIGMICTFCLVAEWIEDASKCANSQTVGDKWSSIQITKQKETDLSVCVCVDFSGDYWIIYVSCWKSDLGIKVFNFIGTFL